MSLRPGSLRLWLPLALLAFGLAFFVNVAVQQSYRQSANDPQIQLAEDTAATLANGATPDSLIPNQNVDLATSLAPAIIIYDEQTHPLTGSGHLKGVLPSLPAGSYHDARNNGEVRVTWEPQPGVRQAAVLVHTAGNHGFVLATRSLREVESREDHLALMTALTLAASLVGTFVLILIAP